MICAKKRILSPARFLKNFMRQLWKKNTGVDNRVFIWYTLPDILIQALQTFFASNFANILKLNMCVTANNQVGRGTETNFELSRKD